LLPALLAGAGAVAIACSSSNETVDAGSGCLSAPDCPDGGVPSYKNDIVPILQQDCIPCHSPSGVAGFDETTYADVYGQYGSMLSQVAICAMPPLNGPQLSSAQRLVLTAWLKCEAPNN